jgi:hypothetical protein
MDNGLMRTRSTLITLVAIGSLLGACHKNREQPPAEPAAEAPTPVARTTTPQPKPKAKPRLIPATARVEAVPKPTADEQMLDDAEATGMTSHAAPHNPETPDAVANSQP